MEQAQNPAPEQAPQSSQETAPARGSEAAPAAAPEKGRPRGDSASQGPSPTLPPVSPSVVATPAAQDPPTTPQPPAQSNNPGVADDVDVIEKEWVEKAKNIVHKTKDDPHRQKKEMSVFKADYMMKRYGKEIKLVED